ncbi:elongation factor P--(R)-beta-lysine ligase [Legionella sp. CNM-4043-24]|uniref:elongation factor P--(R)-beta-lysine ligase n=1 Tax=Legionella sp. CNM-4043-24 TaxID=3421646 RepID=UPI00403B1552
MSWQPSATLANLRQRATLIATIRRFFTERHYLEVETPVMARHGVTDVYLSNMTAGFRGQSYCLQTSPEYHMKRLLAAGSGAIFQLARVFRDDELGRWHNPEFTLLEWYQPGIDHHALMDEMDALLRTVLSCPPLLRKTYQQAFVETCQLDPFTASLSDLRQCVSRFELANVLPPDEPDRDQYLFLLMSHVVEPAYASLDAPLAVYHFPASQAALAQVNHGVAERFEIYYRGVELANGFHELTDAEAQAQRFADDNWKRQEKGLPQVAADQYLLDALAQGLPACSGVALGVDRLMALALGVESIAETQAFDFSRA